MSDLAKQLQFNADCLLNAFLNSEKRERVSFYATRVKDWSEDMRTAATTIVALEKRVAELELETEQWEVGREGEQDPNGSL